MGDAEPSSAWRTQSSSKWHVSLIELQKEKKMKIAIASDHGGFDLKQKLIEYYQKQNIELEN